MRHLFDSGPVTTGKLANSLRGLEVRRQGEPGIAAWDEPKELDTDNEAVISLYDGIKKILESQSKPKVKVKRDEVVTVPREAKHVLQCGRILKVDVERRLVVITVMKTDGELHQLRIEASGD
ncbi:hypothetical protein J2P12_01340 [Candidatus Bathyarchaeota archaeon]|nr:hypothetical protein [Candidatus Bathyarchaeota archaeon]